MNPKLTTLAFSLTMVLAAPYALAGTSQQHESAQEVPGAAAIESESEVMTVLSVDQKSRMVTLQFDDGETMSFVAGDGIRNLAQLEAGQQVVVQYEIGMIMALNPSGTGTVERQDSIEMARAEVGQLPGGMVRKKVEVSAVVTALDPDERTVTLQGPNRTVTLPIADDIDLDAVKVGDQVDAMFLETLAISVEPAAADADE